MANGKPGQRRGSDRTSQVGKFFEHLGAKARRVVEHKQDFRVEADEAKLFQTPRRLLGNSVRIMSALAGNIVSGRWIYNFDPWESFTGVVFKAVLDVVAMFPEGYLLLKKIHSKSDFVAPSLLVILALLNFIALNNVEAVGRAILHGFRSASSVEGEEKQQATITKQNNNDK